MRNRYMTVLCGATALTAVATLPGTASAQAAQPQAQTGDTTPATSAVGSAAEASSKDITVTARRRNENIVDVPLAITVVSAETLEKLNLRSTRDIANFVPSLEFSDFTQGNSRNDRGQNRTIIFRGLNLPNNGGSVTQAASIFLDGAAVTGNEIPASLDIGAVEVLRGPQSVYFGRASMTGAISYRTKAIPKDITLETNIELAERKTFNLEASVAGQVVPDLLGFRVTGLYETNDGYITNAYDASGPKLGSRSRKSLSGTVEFTPSSRLEVKGYANYFEDEDGPSATVNIFPDAQYTGTERSQGTLVSLGSVTNCLKGITNNGVNARATLCGEVPGISKAVAYSRTDIPAEAAAVLFDYSPYIAAEHFKHMAGTQRHAFNSQAVINYEVSDYLKAQSITGYHVSTTGNFIDGIQQPVKPTSQYAYIFFGSVTKFKDFSQELRLSSDPSRNFSWTAGANYINAKVIGQAFNVVLQQATPGFPAPTPPLFNGTSGAFSPSDNRGTTYGFFGGAYLKLLDKRLTLSAEGRYQIDDRFAQTLNAATLAPLATSGPSGQFDQKFYAFYPRVSADFDIGGGRKVYASYAKGGRAGGFNSTLLSFFDPNNSRYATCGCYAASVAQINQLFGSPPTSFKQETLNIGEVGFKGYLAHGKGYFDLNAYYGILSNQQVSQGQVITALVPATTLSIIVNTGKTQIYGLEFTGNYNFTPTISLDTTFSWNHTKRLAYIDNAPGTIAQFGISDFSGLKLPLAPLVSGSAVLSYEEPRSDHWSPFANAALVYRGKQYADIANYSYIPGRATVDLRVGGKNGRFRMEGFVTNLFQNTTYPAGNVAAEFGTNQVNGIRSSYSGFFGAYAEPRTFGVRASAGF